MTATPEDNPVDLHLLAGLGLEAHDGVVLLRRPERHEVEAQHGDSTRVAAVFQLAEQHGGWDSGWLGRCDAAQEVFLERFQLGEPLLTRPVAVLALAAKYPANRVAREAGELGNLSDALALAM